MKILIIAPNWLGDLIISQSLIKAIKIHYPKSQIDLCVRKSIAGSAKRFGEVNQIIINPVVSGSFSLIKQIKLSQKIKNKYDWAIVLPTTFKSALAVFLAKIKKRTGFLGEFRYGLINDIIQKEHKPNNKEKLSQQAIYLSLIQVELAGLGSKEKLKITPRLKVDVNNRQKQIERFSIDTNQKIIAFAMGSNYGKAKQWPIENYQQLALKLISQNYQIMLIGSEKEKILSQSFFNHPEITQKLTQKPNAIIDAIGKTNLTDAIDLLSLSKVLVTNDSGLMHLATGLSVGVAAIYGSTSPKFTPPLAIDDNQVAIFESDLKCSPCFAKTCRFGHYDCLKQTGSDSVFKAITDLIQ